MADIFACVVDIETTGLSARDDVPLEIGAALIDKDGEILGQHYTLVWEQNDDFQRGVTRGLRNDFVNDMHVKNGLWEALDKIKHTSLATYSREDVDNQLCVWLEQHGVEWGKVPMLGNSIGSLDRPFVIQHFPHFNEALSYRNIDISTIKELCKAHNNKLWVQLEPIVGNKENATHRVWGDIVACIKEYQAYIDNFFFIED